MLSVLDISFLLLDKNYQRFGGIKQHTFIVSHFSVSQGTSDLASLHTCHQPAMQVSSALCFHLEFGVLIQAHVVVRPI